MKLRDFSLAEENENVDFQKNLIELSFAAAIRDGWEEIGYSEVGKVEGFDYAYAKKNNSHFPDKFAFANMRTEGIYVKDVYLRRKKA